MQSKLVRVLIAFLAGGLASASMLLAAPASADHEGYFLHWGSTETITIEDHTGEPYVREGIAETVRAFNAEKGGLRLHLAWRIGPADNACPHQPGVVSVCLPPSLDNSGNSATYGVSCNYLTAHCTSGSVQGNRTALLPLTSPATFFVRHELGHILGMGHSNDYSVMNVSGNGKQTDNFSVHDWTVLAGIYMHADSPLLSLLDSVGSGLFAV